MSQTLTPEALDKAVENIPTRAERRRMKRAIIKQLNPPQYGPVVIISEKHELVDGKVKKGYVMRTNIQDLEAFERAHRKPLTDPKTGRVIGHGLID